MSSRVGVKNPGSRATLNEKQLLFIGFYLETGMISESVILAGYKTKNPQVRGTQLLLSPLVKKTIAEERAKRRKIEDEEIYSKIMTRAQIQFERHKIASSNLALIKSANLSEIPEEMQVAVSSIKINKDGNLEVTLWDKLKALKDLDEHLKEREETHKLEDSLVIDNALQQPEYDNGN